MKQNSKELFPYKKNINIINIEMQDASLLFLVRSGMKITGTRLRN